MLIKRKFKNLENKRDLLKDLDLNDSKDVFRLCYVKEIERVVDAFDEFGPGCIFLNEEYDALTSTHYAYFCNRIKYVRGDNWDRNYYGTQSSPPYDHSRCEDGEVIKILELSFSTRDILKTPEDWSGGDGKCIASVNDINKGALPWLSGVTEGGNVIRLEAGDTLSEFITTIKELRNDL